VDDRSEKFPIRSGLGTSCALSWRTKVRSCDADRRRVGRDRRKANFRWNGIETVPHERKLEELAQEFAARAHGARLPDCRRCPPILFPTRDHAVAAVWPFFGKTAGMCRSRTHPGRSERNVSASADQSDRDIRLHHPRGSATGSAFADCDGDSNSCSARFDAGIDVCCEAPSRLLGANQILFHHRPNHLIACAMRRVSKSRAPLVRKEFLPGQSFPAWQQGRILNLVVTIIVMFCVLDDDRGAKQAEPGLACACVVGFRQGDGNEIHLP